VFWAPGSFQTPYFTVFFRFRFHMAPSSILTPKNTVKYSVFQLSNAQNTVFYDVFTPKWSKNRPLGSSWETYVGSSWRSWGPCWLMGVHLSAKVCARCLNIAPREWPNRVSGDVWRLIFDVKVWINNLSWGSFLSFFLLCWLMLAILGAMFAHLGALWSHFVAKLSQDGAKMAQHRPT